MGLIVAPDADAALPQAVEAWAASHPTNTARTYRNGLRIWLTWCERLGHNPDTASLDTARAFTTWLGQARSERTGEIRKPASQATIVAAISAYYDHLIGDAVDRRNPWKLPKVGRPHPSNAGTTRALDAGQVARLLAAAENAGPRTHLAVTLMWRTGMRADSTLAVRCRDIAIEDGEMVIRVRIKGGGDITVPIPDDVADLVDRVRGDRATGGLLDGPDGKGMSYRSLLRAVSAAGERAGLGRVTPHMARATLITEARGAGLPTYFIQALTGHANEVTVGRYDRGAGADSRKRKVLQAVGDAYRRAAS